MSLRFASMLAGLAVTAMLLAAGSAPAAGLVMLAIAAPADMTVTADAVCGQSNCAQVFYTFTVSGGYPPYHQVCTPVDSGSYFLVGTHTVSCLAQDSEGNSTPYASFTLTVNPPSSGGGSGGGGNGGGGGGGSGGGNGGSTPAPGANPGQAPLTQDTTSPVIAPHANITIPAETPAGAPFTYSVVASDPDDTGAQVTLACQPASGSNFRLRPNGTTETTTVTCDAHDRAGNKAKKSSFTVTVLGGHAQIIALQRFLTTAKQPSNERRHALVATLGRANSSLNTHDITEARSILRSFIAEIRKHPPLSAHEAATLISTATRIEHVIA